MTTPTTGELVIRGLRVAPAAPRPRDPPGHRPHDPQGRGPRDDGPNGLGKTTLSYALMGHPAYLIKSGEVSWKGYDLLKLSADKRSRLGLFLAFQYPTAIPGLLVASFIRSTLNAKLQGIDKNPDVDPTDTAGRGLDARLPAPDAREDGAAQDGGRLRGALRQRRLRAARAAPRDAPDGEAFELEFAILDETDSGLEHPRAADRRGGRQRPAHPAPGRAAHHPLPAAAQLHRAGLRPRARGRPVSSPWVARTSRCGSRRRAMARSRARTGWTSACPTRRSPCRSSPRLAGASRLQLCDDDDSGARDDVRDPHAVVPTDPLDPETLRADFPILHRKVNGQPPRLPR